MTAFRQDLDFGATLLSSNRTRFRLWAPGCDHVALEIDRQPAAAMCALTGGWFEAEADCGAGAQYRYRVRPDLAVPDPAARAQSGGVHGRSVVVDPENYVWRHPDWRGRPWCEAVLYELHVGVLGGFAGVKAQLPSLRRLGVTGIELMPVAEFPGSRGWGYDGVLPYASHAAYGSPDALKDLIDTAHGLGLSMVLDVVYNHFGPDGNYLAAYAPAFFRHDHTTPWGDAIDFRQDAVRRFFIQNALYWLNEYRFDGLRFDAVHAIKDDAFVGELAARIRADVDPQRTVWLILENVDNRASDLRRGYDGQWNDDFHHALHALLTGERDGYYEDFADAPAARLAIALRDGFVYQGEPSKHAGGAPRGEPSADLPTTAFVDFLQNHDQSGNRAFGERLTVLAEPAALQVAMSLLLLMPQTPMLFMGEEVGSTAPFLYFTDHGRELAAAVREGRRREFASFPAFADPARRSLIPDPNAVRTFELSKPTPGPDADAWRALCGKLIALRLQRIAPRLAGAKAIEAKAIGPKAVAARWRLGDDALLTLAANLGAGATALPWPLGKPSLWVIGAAPANGQLGPMSFAAWLEQP